MESIPAVCENCGNIFDPRFIGISGNATVTVVDTTVGPCPYCGGRGRIIDGTYKIIENIIDVLSAPQRTVDELNKLSNTLKRAQKSKYSGPDLKEKIEKEIPSLSGLTELFPKTREEKRSDIKFLITTLLAALAILIPLVNENNTSNVQENIQVDQIIKNIYNIENQQNNMIMNPSEQFENNSRKEPVRVNKIGRNEPCPCGSGLKFKRCHGR